jgi:hypothetical protein
MYKNLVVGMAVVMILLGLGMLSIALRRGGSVGYVLGALFVAAGVGRLLMLRRRSSGS